MHRPRQPIHRHRHRGNQFYHPLWMIHTDRGKYLGGIHRDYPHSHPHLDPYAEWRRWGRRRHIRIL